MGGVSGVIEEFGSTSKDLSATKALSSLKEWESFSESALSSPCDPNLNPIMLAQIGHRSSFSCKVLPTTFSITCAEGVCLLMRASTSDLEKGLEKTTFMYKLDKDVKEQILSQVRDPITLATIKETLLHQYGKNSSALFLTSTAYTQKLVQQEPIFDLLRVYATCAMLGMKADLSNLLEVGVFYLFQDRSIPYSKEKDRCNAESAISRESSLILHGCISQILLSSENNTAIIPEGTFDGIIGLVGRFPGNVRILKTSDTEFKVTARSLESLVKAYPKSDKYVLFLTNPTNPFGLQYSEDELREIGRVALRNRIFVVNDEHFSGLSNGDTQTTSYASLVEKIDGKDIRLYDYSVTVLGTTKILGTQLGPLGFALSGDLKLMSAVRALVEERDRLPTVADALSGIKRIQGLSAGHISNITELSIRRKFLSGLLDETNQTFGMNLIAIRYEPQGGIFTCISFPRWLMDRHNIRSSKALSNFLYENAGIITRPVDGMLVNKPNELFVRINYSYPSLGELRRSFLKIKELLTTMISATIPQASKINNKVRPQLT